VFSFCLSGGFLFDSVIFSLCLEKILGMLLESFVVAGLWK